MRYSHLQSSRVRRTLMAAATLSAVGLTAACSDDVGTSAPTGPVGLDRPNAILQGSTPTAAATVRIVDPQGVTLTEKLFIKFYLNGSFSDTVTVYDNSVTDQDPAIGKFKVYVPQKVSWKVCAQGISATFSTDYYLDACKTVAGNTSTVNVGSVVAHRKPVIKFPLKSWTGVQLKGAAIQWMPSGGKDNDQFSTGTIIATRYQPGTYEYCEVKAPDGYNFATPTCDTITVAWDQVYIRPLIHQPIISVQLP